MTKAVAKKAKATKATKVVAQGIASEDVSSLKGKSAMIRFYLAKGYERKEIANHLGIRYQHVRNVEVTLLKRDITK